MPSFSWILWMPNGMLRKRDVECNASWNSCNWSISAWHLFTQHAHMVAFNYLSCCTCTCDYRPIYKVCTVISMYWVIYRMAVGWFGAWICCVKITITLSPGEWLKWFSPRWLQVNLTSFVTWHFSPHFNHPNSRCSQITHFFTCSQNPR